MSRNKLVFASGILSLFMAAANAVAVDAAPVLSDTPQAVAATETFETPPAFITVHVTMPGGKEPTTVVVGDREKFRTVMADIRQKSGVKIELDGAVIVKNEKGETGYISYFEGWDFSDMDLSGITIRNAVFFNAKAARTDFSNTKLENVMLAGIKAPDSKWHNVMFDITDPAKAVRGGGCIKNANTDLSGADFSGGAFIGMNWDSTNMEGAILPKIIRAAVRNPGTPEQQIVETSFEAANLQKAALKDAKVSGTNMSHIDIRGADLRGTEFHDMKAMLEIHFDEHTKLAGAQFINSVPPYELVKLKEKQEQKASIPQLYAWRPGR